MALATGERLLFLTREPALVARQLAGDALSYSSELELASDVSTDEMAPAWGSYFYDERLGEHCLTGFRGGAIGLGAVREGGFGVLVAGANCGCGSSRETAPYAQLLAGIRLVVAKSFGRIYRQNCQNIGLRTTTDLGVVERLARGETLEPDALVEGADPVVRALELHGGLLGYARARLEGRASPPDLEVSEGPQTMAQKIIAAHAVRDASGEQVGAPGVRIGSTLLVRADLRFSHEYVTPMADALFRHAFGEEARVRDPERVLCFRDHLTFVEHVFAGDAKRLPLLEQARTLPEVQARFAERHGIRLFGEQPERGPEGGSEAICHEAVLESFAEPGGVVVGTDSHTSTAGAAGCLAFGVGSSDMAAAWLTRDVRLTVPESVRVELVGALRPGVTAKDAMLALFLTPAVRDGLVTGTVLEFGGEGLFTLPLDERATLTNMAVEAGALTGIAEVDASVARELATLRAGDARSLAARAVRADPGARYVAELRLELDRVEPMVALPGDPKRVRPLAELAVSAAEPLRIDIAYGGTCTGGKRADMDRYAAVFAPAVARGERIAPGVRLFLQVASERVRRYAEERGYLSLFEAVGATVLGPACGACIAAGPGTSRSKDEVTISAGSRNFPGRSGPGQVILASPLVVAASALKGFVAAPSEVRA